jgi:hypothetical protein
VASAYLRVRHEQGLSRSAEEILLFSPSLEHYAQASASSLSWGWLSGASSEFALFPGLTVLALAVVALAGTWRRGAAGADSVRRAAVAVYGAVLAAAVILSLGPQPALFGHTLPFPGPYAWFVAIVPGLDGLRVPARLGMIVALALAVLAALGLDRLTRGRTRRVRGVLVASCALAILVEGLPRPQTATRIPSKDMSANRAAFEWLSTQTPGPMLDLPIGNTALKVRYVYQTLVHRNRIVNGYSGYRSPLQDFVGVPFGNVARLDEALTMARALGIRWVAVHTELYGRGREVGDEVARTLRSDTTHVARAEYFGAVTVAELRPLSPPVVALDPAWAELKRPAFAPTAFAHADSLPLAFDGDVSTRWSTGDRQRGTEWVTLTFPAPIDVARVRLEVDEDSATQYPRGLVVAGSDDGTHFEPLFDGPVADRLAVSLAREPRAPAIDLVLPPNRTRVLRLSTHGETLRNEWSIPELRLWRR